MSYTIGTASFLNDLDRVSRIRQDMANALSRIALTLRQAESDGTSSSGELGLEREIEDIDHASRNLRQGVFRLLVLGDMKRGKSTFLNALIGENLLPSDVNPCTALLTVLRYGSEKKVTVHFNDGKAPEPIDFKSFKQRYTIAPEEAKELERNQQMAFPDVSHAVVEYPLPLLQKGIEIVDSPGLNDTEARNELSLGYINNCHAILFVLRASQPCTLAERRYLENYIKDRGLSIFFLINAWDQIKESLIDPDDAEELAEAEAKLHRVFRSNLADYCRVEGHDFYEERVFAISALTALRRRIKDSEANLEGTGFPAFMAALNTFLTQERAIAEFRQARTLARQAWKRVQESVNRRVPLLDQDVNELKQRIQSVEPEFQKLTGIRDQFRDEIRTLRDRRSRAIADSFRDYVLNLESTFETDFLRYQPPNLPLLSFFSQGQRDEFNRAFQRAFEQYANDRFCAWSRTAERDLRDAFEQLSRIAARYSASYLEATDTITAKLTGQRLQPRTETSQKDDSPGWAKWAMGLFSLAAGNPTGIALAASGFDFQSILLNFFTSAGLALVASALFGIVLGPITFALMGLGIGALQADQARKELTKATKRELAKYLPKIAQEHWQTVYGGVQECFDSYEDEVIRRIDDDIRSRKSELDNLLQQKQSREINRDAEMARLQQLEAIISADHRHIESTYEQLLSYST